MVGATQLRISMRRPVRSQWARSLGFAPSRRASPRVLAPATTTPFPTLRSLSTTHSPRAEAFHAQLENAPTSFFAQQSKTPQTLTEKIVQRHAVGLPEGKVIRSGDKFALRPHKLMTHDNSVAVIKKWKGLNATKIHDPNQLVMTLDHDVQSKNEVTLQGFKMVENFAKEHGVEFFPAGRGIGHQIMVEEGFAWPGTMTVASDSHSNTYGGLGCAGVAVVRSDAAAIYATGRTWWECPPVARVNLTGVLRPGVSGKDVIVALCGVFNSDVLNHCVEFTGSEETMNSLSIDTRLTISNMTTEWGALSGLFPIDATLERWLREKATEAAKFPERSTSKRMNHERIDELFANPVRADPNAVYAKELYLNLSSIASPYVSGPNSVKVATPVHELAQQNIKIQKAYLVSCTNSRHSDIQAAASVFREAAKANGGVVPKIADGVEMYVAAASSRVQDAAEASGDWQILRDAGARFLISGCGPCIGLGVGLLEAGEIGISASNRNFVGRMGSREAFAYLGSPEVVAASALKGVITGPQTYEGSENWTGIDHGYGNGQPRTIESQIDDMVKQMDSLVDRVESTESESSAVELLPGFPESVGGEIVFMDKDNQDTDQIYPGSMTYKSNVSKEDMAKACMTNYDPNFQSVIKPNDILVSGYNFGSGSSREQETNTSKAATAILANSIPLVVAGSFSNIFSRNSINNGLMGLELPRLVKRLREAFPADAKNPKPTLRTGWTLKWDVKKSMVDVQEGQDGEKWSEKVGDVPPNVQEIIALGGLEEWCKHQLKAASS